MALPLYVKAVARATTKLPGRARERSVIRLSVIPSAKYSCVASPLRLANGRTTIDSFGAGLSLADIVVSAVSRFTGQKYSLAAHTPAMTDPITARVAVS